MNGEKRHRFDHDAMACTWLLELEGEGASDLAAAAHATFEELDRLELELSRFVESSDIARLAELSPGDSLVLGLDAYDCLALAAEVSRATDHAFDVTLGAGPDAIELDPRNRTATVHRSLTTVDLGALGKGHAVDVARHTLEEWGIEAGWITSGQSTLLPFGRTVTVALRDPSANPTTSPVEEVDGTGAGSPVTDGETPRSDAESDGTSSAPPLRYVQLDARAFSGSGAIIHGHHIVDPRTGQSIAPGRDGHPHASWAIAPTAALSDALSTTLLIVDPNQIPRICETWPDVTAIWLDHERTLNTAGAAPGWVD